MPGVEVFRVTDEEGPGPERAGEVAYVMFTSGSTGVPKGVQVSHSANLAFQRWVKGVFGVTERDRFVQTSSLAFGGSIRQMLTPLLHGASIHPVPKAIARDPDALIEFIRAEGITIWNSVPSLWAKLMDSLERLGGADPLPSVRWVLLGGEAVPAEHVRRWWSMFGGRYRLANLYGSTESIVNATWFEVTQSPAPDVVHTPIGWPRSGVDCLVEEDELLVGGAVADGYLGRPEATAAAFVERSGRRYYRTGDRVRQLDDGAFVYLGRIDSQVQVWGNRVEPKEIEHHLCGLPGVRSALIVQEPDGRLYGAFEGSADPLELRRALAVRLPAYMVPHRLEAVRSLPRSPAGKLDRRRLQAERSEVSRSAPVPSATSQQIVESPALAAVRRAWIAVLGLDHEPGPDADFFEEGGDSLLLLDVLDALRGELPDPPSPQILYAAASLRGMAEALLATAPAPRVARSELTAVERGFLRDGDEQPIWTAVVPLHGPLDRRAFERALAWLVQRHEALRAVFPTSTTRSVLPEVDVALQYDDLTGLASVDRALEARWDEARELRFDPAVGPLVHVRLSRVAQDEHRLLLAAHHVVADAWSAWLLAGELLAAHEALARGASPSLAPASTLRPTDRATVDPWWGRKLAGLTQRPATSTTGGRASVTVPEHRWRRLVDAGRERGIPPFALVLGALARALGLEFETSDLVISTALSGRDEVAGARTAVGSWARALPIRLGPDLSDSAVLTTFSTARLHSNTSPASMVGTADLRALGRWFLTWLDPAAVLEQASGDLVPDWVGGRYSFDTRATGTEVLVSAMPVDGLHLQLVGGPVVDSLAQRLERELGGVDAALVVYPPPGITAPVTEPVVIETVHGADVHSELVLLPSHAGAATPLAVVDAAVRATEASVVALAGMLPSWTGLAVPDLGRDDQVVTTGHAATVAAMVLTLEAVLDRLGRTWADEDVACVGWGSIGRSVAALAVARLGQPSRLRRVDPALVDSDSSDGATLILGASSGGASLDVETLPAGAVVIDDSFPRSFDDAAAWARMRQARDVLLVGGGCFDIGALQRTSPFPQAEALRAMYPSRWLPGCHAEAVLLALRPDLGPTRGTVDEARAALVLEAALTRGWTAAPLHLGPDEIPTDVLDAMRLP